MKITDSAWQTIVKIMKSKNLNPKNTFLEIGVFEGNLGISFTKEPIGKRLQFGELNVVVSGDVECNPDLVIDFGEINNKKGLIFLGEKNVNNSN